MATRGALLLLLVPLAGAGCRTDRAFVWGEDYRQEADPADREYVIRAGDVLQVRVWSQDSASARARVRPDGRISVPFLGDVEAAGATPAALSRQLQERLKAFLVKPSVTVSLEEPRPLAVSVLGEVAKVGTYPLEAGAGLLEALAAAGGPTTYADLDRVMVLRRAADGTRLRIRFRYEALVRLEGAGAAFRLRHGDVVVVE